MTVGALDVRGRRNSDRAGGATVTVGSCSSAICWIVARVGRRTSRSRVWQPACSTSCSRATMRPGCCASRLVSAPLRWRRSPRGAGRTQPPHAVSGRSRMRGCIPSSHAGSRCRRPSARRTSTIAGIAARPATLGIRCLTGLDRRAGHAPYGGIFWTHPAEWVAGRKTAWGQIVGHVPHPEPRLLHGRRWAIDLGARDGRLAALVRPDRQRSWRPVVVRAADQPASVGQTARKRAAA